jgi:hypothetical protein
MEWARTLNLLSLYCSKLVVLDVIHRDCCILVPVALDLSGSVTLGTVAPQDLVRLFYRRRRRHIHAVFLYALRRTSYRHEWR